MSDIQSRLGSALGSDRTGKSGSNNSSKRLNSALGDTPPLSEGGVKDRLASGLASSRNGNKSSGVVKGSGHYSKPNVHQQQNKMHQQPNKQGFQQMHGFQQPNKMHGRSNNNFNQHQQRHNQGSNKPKASKMEFSWTTGLLYYTIF